MVTREKFKILDAIGKVYDAANKCKLTDGFFEKVDHELRELVNYFGLSTTQSFFTAIIFTLNYKGDTVDMKDLNEYFDCNPMKLLEFNEDFRYLEEKGVFKVEKSNHRIKVHGANNQYTINEKISEAILNHQPMPKLESEIKDIYELLEQFYKLCLQHYNQEIGPLTFKKKAESLLNRYTNFKLIEKIKSFGLEMNDTLLYLYLIWKTISGKQSCDLEVALDGILRKPTKRMRYMQNIIAGKNELVSRKLIEVNQANFFNDTHIKLTSTSNSLLKSFGISVFLNPQNNENLIKPDAINSKELIYNPDEMKQLYLLKDLLKPKHFDDIVKRLADKSLPKGITALLHGAPGTGKTEAVKQMAKETNRNLMKVDISQSKSKWFGESEKVVKKIFTDYKSLMQDCDNVPILLFNEADAIITKRSDTGTSNTRQTENAMQNIILEELENFEGILIATTNLPGNLDSAFERRFLFKIEFKKAKQAIRAKIWQSKMKLLNKEQCNLLAHQFDFSGGQIENIVRKTEIQEIIHGKAVNFGTIKAFCKEETLNQKHNEIGFTKIYNHV